MKSTFLILIFMILSAPSFACWKMQATLSVGADKVKIDQKIDHDKTYTFGSGNHIFHLKVPKQFNPPANVKLHKDARLVEVGIQEKNGIKLSETQLEQIFVQVGNATFFTKDDPKTKELTKFDIKLTDI